ncbi:M14 family metallopeptidase [Desulfovibrio sp. TomC]|uniref:M14 family metallopeptidase n=1 Tax=Desulfovibrio sp. TomC TaxID=1562888 RepID=UPI0005759353|nr:M14 family metallopeptidase [Desulfovibrio sp. TomC]KHK03836.1 putative periplasmic protein [Desulfovibrio sp. TomC]
MRFILALLLLLLPAATALCGNLDFTLHKLDSGRPGPTILVIGGIQGDEPGGFSAAALLVSHYKIKSGSVWVVPNLNFLSIIRCSRGVYGDMNRKFAELDPKDPEYEAVQKIKAIIRDEQVTAVLHLHDGWGYYSPTFVTEWQCPLRWGQSVIIDQESAETTRFGNLQELAARAVSAANDHLYEPLHAYHVKNTHTKTLDDETAKEMSKTLTYFAIGQGKPAFGIEGSKNLPPAMRSYYHLRVIESFLKSFGVEYERTFELGAPQVAEALQSNVAVSFFDNKVYLDLRNARERLRYIPLKKDSAVEYQPASPLLALVSSDKSLKVYFGNTNVTELDPQFMEFDSSLASVPMEIDGVRREVPFGKVVDVRKGFSVAPSGEYRVNVIGFSKPGLTDEAGVTLTKAELKKEFSVDKAGTVYRVEVYKGEKFCGMILASFAGDAPRMAKSDDALLRKLKKNGEINLGR